MSPELNAHRSKDHSSKDFERWGALPVHSRRAMVATADTDATNAAVAVLREGGSVVDAAITAAFALSVTQPGMCGLGGGGHLLARLANGQTLCLDFREQAPHSASRDMFVYLPAGASGAGWLAAATPGLVKGLAEAHRREGRLSWSRLLQPAITLAAEGHTVSYLRSQMLAASAVLRSNTESTRILLREGRCFQPGEILRQPELAATLERIAMHGGDEFYHGKTADLLIRACIANGGALRSSDLDSFTCAEHQPLMRTYRGREVWAMPPSSAGGIGLLQILAMFEGTSFPVDAPLSSAFLHHLAEAMRRAFADRAAIGDPSFVEIPKSFLDSDRLARLRASIDPRHATPSSALGHGVALEENTCTTHVSVLDGEGNAAALTFTINARYGSGVTVPGLGFLLNNNMDNFAIRPGQPNQYGVVHGEANAIEPGKRPLSSMAPTIVSRNGKPDLVLGTPGGPTIISAIAQVLLYILEFDWNPQDAVNAPRIHHQWLPDTIFLERGFPTDVTQALEARGHRLEYRTSLTDINAIAVRDGWLEGGVDPRREGCAAGI
ncbi:MAG TPA: gamma-glutamyltransferase [Bryocella sp.]|nr:gamma-glutamyltransferase [Bryocella sp.]